MDICAITDRCNLIFINIQVGNILKYSWIGRRGAILRSHEIFLYEIMDVKRWYLSTLYADFVSSIALKY